MKNKVIAALVTFFLLLQLGAETFFEKVDVDTSNHHEFKREKEKVIFLDEDRDLLTAFRIPYPSDLPDPRNSNKFTETFAVATENTDAILVEAKGVFLDDGVWAGYVLNAFPQDPTGYTFQVTIYIPTTEESIMLQVNCVERGTTGIREATVWAQEALEGDGKNEYSLLTTWDVKHDALFPKHSLSRVRRKAAKIIESIHLNTAALESSLYPKKLEPILRAE
ncbi:MAG: hypothetical protein ACSHX8_09155 [Opitutaceae bacterium]